ncbi:helix-turn-helix transcriptional regulator [Actinotalea sp. K2]|uniref:helix-turn-helix transcriptional regulator n=1 Tax=Actinotalea sp. K2 TaxID=2939438 RepID=UPI0020175F47|nr:helix-turn-helix transcriptional regulator [Actinotalea sp. K2]MCL3861249.1 helix-turn-helix transcriptional regulator [Actinotalea sp. K2]
MATDARERALDKLARMVGEPTHLAELWRGCTEVLGDVLPHYWTPCWFTVDPASLLVTSHVHEGMDRMPDEWLVNEYYGEEVHRIVDVIGSPSGVSTLHEVTGGVPSTTRRWHLNMTLGGDQEMLARLRTSTGEDWGLVGVYREPGAPAFDEEDKRFLRAAGPHLAEGARRALLIGEAAEPDHPQAPGLVILDETWQVRSTTPGVDGWLRELPDGDMDAGRLPSAVLAVAAQARAAAQDPTRPSGAVLSRVRARNGAWVVLHGACLVEDGSRRVAVIVEPAAPDRISPLLMAAYHLTPREKEVTRLVLRGDSTSAIARELFCSPHTVQQHLKSIFDKTGVRSRRDLVGTVFFAHFEPRFRENEQRVVAGLPIRGAPRSDLGGLPARPRA